MLTLKTLHYINLGSHKGGPQASSNCSTITINIPDNFRLYRDRYLNHFDVFETDPVCFCLKKTKALMVIVTKCIISTFFKIPSCHLCEFADFFYLKAFPKLASMGGVHFGPAFLDIYWLNRESPICVTCRGKPPFAEMRLSLTRSMYCRG